MDLSRLFTKTEKQLHEQITVTQDRIDGSYKCCIRRRPGSGSTGHQSWGQFHFNSIQELH